MIKFFLKLVAVLAVIVGLSGCAQKTDVTNINSVVAPGYSAQQVRDAILKAGQGRWVMHETQPGVIDASVESRGHSAKVRIPYSSSSYSIDYVTSNNLRASDGKIHKTYIRWVRNLDTRIQLNLSARPTQ